MPFSHRLSRLCPRSAYLLCLMSDDFDFTQWINSKDHETDVILQGNILHFVIECTEYHKYVKFQIAMCAL